MQLTHYLGFRLGLILVLIAASLVYAPGSGLGEPTELEPFGREETSILHPTLEIRAENVKKILSSLETIGNSLGKTHPLYALWLNQLAAEYHWLGNKAQTVERQTEAEMVQAEMVHIHCTRQNYTG